MLTTEYVKVPKLAKSLMWSYDSVRGCCITNDYYTLGTCEQYAEMLDYVSTHEPTDENLYVVALDIALHSDLERRYGCRTDEGIEAILFELHNRAITTTIELED